MAYTRVNWQNSPSHATPLSAENLNVMDAGIASLDAAVGGHTTSIGTLANLTTTEKSTLVGAINEVNEDVSDVKEDSKYTFDTVDADSISGEYLATTNGAGLIRRDNGTYNTASPVWKHESITVNAGELYRISGVSTNDTFCLAVFLDSNGGVVGYTEDYAGSQVIYTDVLVRVPSNAATMVVNTNTDLFAQAKVREISVDSIKEQALLALNPYVSAIENNGYSELDLEWSMGYINQTTGVYTPRGTGICTADIINLGEKTIITNNHNNTLRVYRFYADGTFMYAWANIQAGNSLAINAPINIKLSLDSAPTLDYKSKIIVKSKVYQSLEIKDDAFTRIFPKWTSGYITNTDGSVVSSANHIHTDELLYTGGKLRLQNLHNDAISIFRYTSDGTYIAGSYKSINAGASWVYDGYDYFKLSMNDAQSVTEANDISIEIIPNDWMSKINGLVDNGSYWFGKKIVWFGTSIPAGVVNAGDTNGNGAYPDRLGRMLGATVYNEAVGSSQARAGSYHNITADDPMGYGGCSAPSLMYSLSLSSTEKQDIIDNWDSKWSNIITWFGSQYDASKATEYKNASWDIKLAKYLTGGSVGQCDLYVFDHGYNDGIYQRGFTDLSDVPASAEDRTYFLGAMRFLIDKILADNPKAKILFIGHYCTDTTNGRSENFLTKYVTDAQEKLASIWQYPLIKTWECMGFNHVPITVNNVQTTVAAQWMPDDLHPSSDTTGEALKHYAEVLYPLVRDVR